MELLSGEKPDQRPPLVYTNGTVKWSKAFTDTVQVKALAGDIAGSKDRARDLGVMLYLVHSPTSILAEWPEADRINEVLATRIIEKDWLKGLMKKKSWGELVKLYQKLGLTAGQRLHAGMIGSIHRFLEELSEIDAKQDPEAAVAATKMAEELLKGLKRIEALIANEGERKIRGGYTPSPFEVPPDKR